jgi:Icc-related predicted phosphoesterase
LRIAALADTHCKRSSQGNFQPLFQALAGQADVLALCGDLTDEGHPDEARVLARELAGSKLPVVAVLGNHDCETNDGAEVGKILADAGVVVLDGTVHEIGGVGFAGVKGFCGGFGEHSLQAWGERGIKAFVHEAVEEALKLESALAKLQTRHRVALLHYSPIAATLQGEDPELLPFLGSGRLADPVDRYPVSAVFHGHAHHGSPEGRTKAGVPVYNVALPMLRRIFPDRTPARILELPD